RENNMPRGKQHKPTGPRTLTKAMRALRVGVVPSPNSAIGRMLTAWRTELVEHCGGTEHVTATQREMIEHACRTKLLIDTASAWLFQSGAIVNKRYRKFYPLVMELARLQDSHAKTLQALGLERVTKPEPVKAIEAVDVRTLVRPAEMPPV